MLFFKNKVKLFFTFKNKSWEKNIPDIKLFSDKILKEVLKVIKVKQIKGMEIGIVLTNDKEIQILNKDYRGKNKPTNVLSFETGDDLLLGDIVMSFDTLKKEASAKKISIKNHYAHLLCHGILHLLSFDHIVDEDAEEMEFFEVKVLERLKIENPYK